MGKRSKPLKPAGDTSFAVFCAWVWDLLAGGKFPIVGVHPITVDSVNGVYEVKCLPGPVPNQDSGLQTFHFKSDGGDYIICRSWDGTTEGKTDVLIAKIPNLMCGPNAILQETIRGIVYNYQYLPTVVAGVTAYYKRVTTGSDGSATNDLVIPDWTVNCVVFAKSVQSPQSLFLVNYAAPLKGITLLEESPRYWAAQ